MTRAHHHASNVANVRPECEWVLARVSDYIDRELVTDDELRMDRHLESCRSCLHTTQQIESTSRVLKTWDAERNRGQVPGVRIERAVLSRAASLGRVRRRSRRQHALWRAKMGGLVALAIGLGAFMGLRSADTGAARAVATTPHASSTPAATSTPADLHVGPALRAREDLAARRVALAESSDPESGLFGRRAPSTSHAWAPAVSRAPIEFVTRAAALPPASWKPFRPMPPPSSTLAAIELRRQRTKLMSRRMGLDPMHAQWVPVQLMADGRLVRLNGAVEATLHPQTVRYVPAHAWARLMKSPSLRSWLASAAANDPRSEVIPATSLETPARSEVEAPLDGERIHASWLSFLSGVRPLAKWVLKLEKGKHESLATATRKQNRISLLSGARVVALPQENANPRALPPQYDDPRSLQDGGRLRFMPGSTKADVVAFVSGTTRPTYLAAGQLLSGGTTDRMIASPIVLPATERELRFTISCVSIRNGVARTKDPKPIRLEAAVAGPTLRRLLAERADNETIQRWVDWYVGVAHQLGRTRAPVLGRSLLDVPGLISFRTGNKTVSYIDFAAHRERELIQALQRYDAAGLLLLRRGGDSSRNRQGVVDPDSAVPAGLDLLHFRGAYRTRLLAQLAIALELESFLHESAAVLGRKAPESLSKRTVKPLAWHEMAQEAPVLYRHLAQTADPSSTAATITPAGHALTRLGLTRSSLAGHATWSGEDTLALHLFID